MSEKKAREESDKAILSRVRKEMAAPRMALSARKWRAGPAPTGETERSLASQFAARDEHLR